MDEYEAGRELDALIAERVMEWRYEPRFPGDTTGYLVTPTERIIYEEWPAFSSDWGAAGLVMDRMAARRQYLWLSYQAVSYLRSGLMHWVVGFAAPERFQATADTAPLAICRAALRWQGLSSPEQSC